MLIIKAGETQGSTGRDEKARVQLGHIKFEKFAR